MHIGVSGRVEGGKGICLTKDGPVGSGECLPDTSMYAILIPIQPRLGTSMARLKSTRK